MEWDGECLTADSVGCKRGPRAHIGDIPAGPDRQIPQPAKEGLMRYVNALNSFA